MLTILIAAAIANSSAQPAGPVAAVERATATVRIIRPAEIRADRLAATEESVLRRTSVRERDGSVRPASLIEFF